MMPTTLSHVSMNTSLSGETYDGTFNNRFSRDSPFTKHVGIVLIHGIVIHGIVIFSSGSRTYVGVTMTVYCCNGCEFIADEKWL